MRTATDAVEREATNPDSERTANARSGEQLALRETKLLEQTATKLAAKLGRDERFRRSVADLVARYILGETPAIDVSFYPRDVAGESSRPPNRVRRLKQGGSVERVLQAIRDGASTRKAICALARVTAPSYSHALKMLRRRGLVRVFGRRRAARLAPV